MSDIAMHAMKNKIPKFILCLLCYIANNCIERSKLLNDQIKAMKKCFI